MTYWLSKKREPANVGANFNLCENNILPTPEDFDHIFHSALFDGKIDLIQNQIKLEGSSLKGCFHMKEIVTNNSATQLILILNINKDTTKQIEIDLFLNKKINKHEIGFLIFENQKVLGSSYYLPGFVN
jgi:hypothetical protein